MKLTLLAALALCLAVQAGAAYDDEGLPETVVSTDTARASEEEEEQPLVQESDEDLAAFVTDYIRRDIQLKGSFFLEDKASRKVYRLQLASVDRKAAPGGNGERGISVVLKDEAGKKFPAVFWVQAGPWGGLDIFRIDFKVSPARGKAGKN